MRHAQISADSAAALADLATRPADPTIKPAGPMPAAARGSRHILGMRVDATRYEAAAGALVARAEAGDGAMVCVCTVHMVMEGVDDPGFQKLVNMADLVTPDGVPLVWALRLLGIPGAERVYGPSLTARLCARAAERGIPVGFYGGTNALLDALHSRLLREHPGLRVAFRFAPPFRVLTPDENARVAHAIRESGARILFVGLGCPKQERWMAARRQALPCVMLGVGAAFDFLAGVKPQAPGFLQRAGLEWLFRLACEPRRLWRRYVLLNPRFVAGFTAQWLRELRGRS